MAHQTHYEVLVKQNGRWEIHGRHGQGEKEQAIEEAKALDGQKHIQGVKVIQEIFDPDEGTSKEYNVYAPGQKKYQPPRKHAKKSPEAADEDGDVSPVGSKNGKNKKKKNSRSLVSILLSIAMISAFSMVVGALFTWFTGMYLADMKMSANAQTNILFIVFLSTFVIAAIPMAIVFLGKNDDS